MSASSESGRSSITDYTRPLYHDVPSFSVPETQRHTIRSYPAPILRRVFTFWHALHVRNLLSGVRDGHAYDRRDAEAPFLLTQVCKEFRAAMEEDCEVVWSTVYINFADVFLSHGEGYILQRLRDQLYLSRDASLAIILQGLNAKALLTPLGVEIRKILQGTRARWMTVAASFSSPSDLADCWALFPLAVPFGTVRDLRIWGSVGTEEGSPIPVDREFVEACQGVERLELRNVAWIPLHQPSTIAAERVRVKSLSIGPSVDAVLGPSTLEALYASFPRVTRLRALAHETSRLTSTSATSTTTIPNSPTSKLALEHVKELTVSPAILEMFARVWQQGGREGRAVLPALMSVSVHFSPTEDESDIEDDDDEDGGGGDTAEARGETTRRALSPSSRSRSLSPKQRRSAALHAVGTFLRVQAVKTLKLHGLDGGYSPVMVWKNLFNVMNRSLLSRLVLEECYEHTTALVQMALTIVPVAGPGSEGLGIHLMPKLKSLVVYKCGQLDMTELPAWVRAEGPKGLKEVVIRRTSEMEETKYEEMKEALLKRV